MEEDKCPVNSVYDSISNRCISIDVEIEVLQEKLKELKAKKKLLKKKLRENKKKITKTIFEEPNPTGLEKQIDDPEKPEESDELKKNEVSIDYIMENPVDSKNSEIEKTNLIDSTVNTLTSIFKTDNRKESIDEIDIDNKIKPKEEDDEEINVIKYDLEKNKILFEKEKKEYYTNDFDNMKGLYPSLNDPNFNSKIYNKKEFQEHQYDGKIKNVEKLSKEICENDFELLPHQQFTKSFMSLDTPYNSILLYHELGTGKTCSAIGITEEMREYMKQTGFLKRIMIIASPNVQVNFRNQLFNPSKLEKMRNGSWNLQTCVGNKLIKEINPTEIEGLTKEQIEKKINVLIRKYYRFMGYDSLAIYGESELKHIKKQNQRKKTKDGIENTFVNDIQNDLPEIIDLEPISKNDSSEIKTQKQKVIQKLRDKYDNRLFVIDEFHNVVSSTKKTKKLTTRILQQIARHCLYSRFVLLSATPLYNSPSEIIWVTNFMNMNDKRSLIEEKDIFDENKEFVKEVKENDVVVKESGENLLKRKLNGYVSYVRGENPYSFPYRIYPEIFAEKENILKTYSYPTKQLNQQEIKNPPKQIVLNNVFINKIGTYQKYVYDIVIDKLSRELKDFDKKEAFGFLALNTPLSVLNISFPSEDVDNYIENKTESFEGSILQNYGKQGLKNIMSFTELKIPYEQNINYQYKKSVLEKHGRIFHIKNIGKFSPKIESICNAILKSTGIVLIYSKYLDGGLLPIALALEEMGFSRYSFAAHVQSFLKEDHEKTPPLNPITMKPKTPNDEYTAKYAMITGTKLYSHNNELDLKLIMDPKNFDGRYVKVVMISEAGSEGLDFKCIRQVHILDPWYNMSRMEQIIGRAVRNKSHCNLDLENRNVEIYMHGTYYSNEIESADMYTYRLAEEKAIQIGKITRLMKETSVDCLLNTTQNNFTEANFNQSAKIITSTQKVLDYKIGDKPFSSKCDYMNQCEILCKNKKIEEQIDGTTYNLQHVSQNFGNISKRLRECFRENITYTLDQLISLIQFKKIYPIEDIYYTLSQFLSKKKEWLVYKNEIGHLIYNNGLYVFQPNYIQDNKATIYERTAPTYYKPKDVLIQLKKQENQTVTQEQVGNVEKIKVKPSTHLSPTTNIKQNKYQYISDKQPRSLIEATEKNIPTDINYLYKLINEHVQIWSQDIVEYLKIKENVKQSKSLELTHTGIRALNVLTTIHNISKNDVLYHLICHFLDMRLFSEKMSFLTNYYKTLDDFTFETSTTFTTIDNVIKSYFYKKMLKIDNFYIVCLTKGKQNELFTWKENSWYSTKQTEKEKPLVSKWLNETFDKSDMILQRVRDEQSNEPHVGFIGLSKSSLFESDGYEFKLKNVLQIRNALGRSCNQDSRQVTIQRLDTFKQQVGKENENYETDGENKFIVISNHKIKLIKHHFCMIYEIFVRLHTEQSKIVWFLTPEESIITDIFHLAIERKKIDNQFVYDLNQKT